MRSLILDGLIRLARMRARSTRAKDGKRRALVVPPAMLGSLGDAAMMNATLATLRAAGFASVDLALPKGSAALDMFDRFVDADGYFYEERRSDLAMLVAGLGRYSHVFLIGADCIDGVYKTGSILRRISLLVEAARVGCDVRILGSSFRPVANPDCVHRLRTMPSTIEICARDPISRQRMEAMLERPISQTADLAFLGAADPEAPQLAPVMAWIREQRAAGRKIVAVNINYLIEEEQPGFALAHRVLIERLLGDNAAILLVPHDTRGLENDESLLRRASDGLAAWDEGRLAWLPAIHPAMIKAALAETDLLITSRMHAAILAAGAGRPAMCFVYQGKFEGLFDLLGLDRDALLFSPGQLVADPGAMAEIAAGALRHSADHAAVLAGALPHIRTLALANFADFPLARAN